MTLAPVVTAIEEARQAGIAPGVAAVVLVRGSAVHASVHGDAQIVPQRRHLTEDDLFDLASLTKLYLASAVARLCDRGVLDLDAPLALWTARSPRDEAITLRRLLAHAAGFAAWRPFHERVAADPVGRLAFLAPGKRPGAEALVAAFRRGRELIAAAIEAEPLQASPGTCAVYSDLGFIALGLAVERIAGTPLDAVIEEEVRAPLGLRQTLFLPGLAPAQAAARRARHAFVSTRAAPARGGEVLCGVVDDDNAWAMGGVAGHAGLFATAADAAAFGQAWLEALAGRSRWLSQEAAARFARRDETPGSERALGWDTPSRVSSLGSRLGRGARGAIGHLGFTGTSLWVDLDREVVCALLTNHVHPGGSDKARINAFRARFHDVVAEALSV